MMKYEEFIASGILELYILRYTSLEENKEVEEMALAYPQLLKEIESIEISMEKHAAATGINPGAAQEPEIMSTIKLIERLKKGEVLLDVPLLSPSSKVSEYQQWIDREDMVVDDADFKGVVAKIIGHTEKAMSAIIWVRDMTADETHVKVHERFLIIEGICNVDVEGDIYSLQPGDYFEIPLHKHHVVTVTSSVPCKAILQRVAV